MKLTTLPVSTKSDNRAFLEMEGMKKGHTKIINGLVVTKWGEDSFEVGTFGKRTMDIQGACNLILIALESTPAPTASGEVINKHFFELLA